MTLPARASRHLLGAVACALVAAASAAPVVLGPPPAAAQARRDAAAEQFVQTNATRVLAVLNDRSMPVAQKRRTFETLVDQVTDVPRITDFVLGKYNRTITPAQKREFAVLFRDFANNVYESRLGEYGGERLVVTGSTIRDSHPHGLLTVEQIIQKSSNVGTVKMAMQMQPREMWEMFSAVGFGQKPPLAFPGLASGKLRPSKSWRPIEQATMSYGYGLSASLFQLARAYSVFARDGQLVPVALTRQDQPAQGEQILRPEVARAVRRMLNMVFFSMVSASLKLLDRSMLMSSSRSFVRPLHLH